MSSSRHASCAVAAAFAWPRAVDRSAARSCAAEVASNRSRSAAQQVTAPSSADSRAAAVSQPTAERGGEQAEQLDDAHRGQQGSGAPGPALRRVAPEREQRDGHPAAGHRRVQGEVHGPAGLQHPGQQHAHREQAGEGAGGEPRAAGQQDPRPQAQGVVVASGERADRQRQAHRGPDPAGEDRDQGAGVTFAERAGEVPQREQDAAEHDERGAHVGAARLVGDPPASESDRAGGEEHGGGHHAGHVGDQGDRGGPLEVEPDDHGDDEQHHADPGAGGGQQPPGRRCRRLPVAHRISVRERRLRANPPFRSALLVNWHYWPACARRRGRLGSSAPPPRVGHPPAVTREGCPGPGRPGIVRIDEPSPTAAPPGASAGPRRPAGRARTWCRRYGCAARGRRRCGPSGPGPRAARDRRPVRPGRSRRRSRRRPTCRARGRPRRPRCARPIATTCTVTGLCGA